jgi:hypothetical protein
VAAAVVTCCVLESTPPAIGHTKHNWQFLGAYWRLRMVSHAEGVSPATSFMTSQNQRENAFAGSVVLAMIRSPRRGFFAGLKYRLGSSPLCCFQKSRHSLAASRVQGGLGRLPFFPSIAAASCASCSSCELSGGCPFGPGRER